MRPASLVAWRCESLKYAGTVMTAFVTCTYHTNTSRHQHINTKLNETTSAGRASHIA
jgi:hypothetical protein